MNSENPPPVSAEEAWRFTVTFVGFLIVLAVVPPGYVISAHIWGQPGLFVNLVYAFLACAFLFGIFEVKRDYKKRTTPYPLLPPRTLTFDVLLLNNRTANLSLDIEYPPPPVEELVRRLNSVLQAALGRNLRELKTSPTFDEIEKLLEPCIAKEVDELRIPVFRYRVTKLVWPEPKPKAPGTFFGTSSTWKPT